MDPETAEIIISQCYQQPCSEKAEAVISRPLLASPGDSAESDGCSALSEEGYGRQGGTSARSHFGSSCFVWAAGTTAVPAPCLSHVPLAHAAFAASKKFSNFHEVGTSVCIHAPVDSCAFYSLLVLTVSLGKTTSDIFTKGFLPTPRSGLFTHKQQRGTLRTLSRAQALWTAVPWWSDRLTGQEEEQTQAENLVMGAVQWTSLCGLLTTQTLGFWQSCFCVTWITPVQACCGGGDYFWFC